MGKNNYFKNKEQNIVHANEIIKLNFTVPSTNISIWSTTYYNEYNVFPIRLIKPYNSIITFRCMNTVDAIKEAITNNSDCKVAALNFASYKQPGGLFLQGSMAQEESLCHNSNLYSILNHFTDYYKENNKNLNRGLYLNRALYIPNVYFYDDVYCDIITCAAPSVGAALRYKRTNLDEVRAILYDRIQFVLNIAETNNVEVLILGAYGCGAFGNDPEIVASVFKELLRTEFNNSFKEVIFAIPGGSNYDIFKKILIGG